MTILIGWIGVDSRSPCSAYLMSDSCISWNKPPKKYDYGKKLFALENSPDIFGFCGDVLFPSQVLSQITDLDRSRVLFPTRINSDSRSSVIVRLLNTHIQRYPSIIQAKTSIYHLSRGDGSTFYAYKYCYDYAARKWKADIISTDYSKSKLIICDGSGADLFFEKYTHYQCGDISNTSRNVYQCFCASLKSGLLPGCGVPPQLVGLYRGQKYNSMVFGSIYENKRYLSGSPTQDLDDYNSVRWYNENFEICDGNNLKKYPTAMRQPNPNL